jgi:hypothetical protein
MGTGMEKLGQQTNIYWCYLNTITTWENNLCCRKPTYYYELVPTQLKRSELNFDVSSMQESEMRAKHSYADIQSQPKRMQGFQAPAIQEQKQMYRCKGVGTFRVIVNSKFQTQVARTSL